jgi:hypothetical protein
MLEEKSEILIKLLVKDTSSGMENAVREFQLLVWC